MKKLIAVAVTLVLMLTLACSAFAEPAEVLKTGWEEILSGIDGVIDVEEIPLSETDPLYSEKYLVVFEQLLDWKNPEAGSFPQRVLISLREDAPVNVIGTEGYALVDMIMDSFVISSEVIGFSSANLTDPDFMDSIFARCVAIEGLIASSLRKE